MSMDLDLGSGSRSGISGPTYLNRPCNMMMSNAYVDVAGCGGGVGAAGQTVDVRSKQQPFDFVSKSPGGMAASMGFFPFTNAQWKELERQAMVFKYMMHSIPVPYDLLFPIISAPSHLSDPSGMMMRDTHLLKFLKNGDPEPGRCRRTDGKKWRCSNAVAPDQKYCEKHVHRGKPRSRKHVEAAASAAAAAASDLNKPHKKPCLGHNQNQSNISPQVSVSKPISGPQNGTCFKLDQLPRSTARYSNAAFQLPSSPVRNGDLSEKQWQQLMELNTGNTDQFQHQMSLNSYTQPKQDPREMNLFLNPGLKTPTSELVDSWTINCASNTSNTHHEFVSLGLSMGQRSYNEDDKESENKQEQTHDITNWLTHSGGPLGEVLRLPLTPSPTTATGASSPSSTGVLQEADDLLSDGTKHIFSATTFPSQSQFGNQDKLHKQGST